MFVNLLIAASSLFIHRIDSLDGPAITPIVTTRPHDHGKHIGDKHKHPVKV